VSSRSWSLEPETRNIITDGDYISPEATSRLRKPAILFKIFWTVRLQHSEFDILTGKR
jgi:hypothetical protein